MVTREQAEKAQDVLGARLARPDWLRGIGLTHDDAGSWMLKVNVRKKTADVMTVMKEAAMEVQVPILVEEVGDIVAQPL